MLRTLHNAGRKVPQGYADFVKVFSSIKGSAEDLLSFVQSVEAARNAEDIAFDLTNAATAARRYFDSGIPPDQPQDAICAIEIVADHALRGSMVGRGDSPFSELSVPMERAVEVSNHELHVVCLGLSEKGRLVRVDVDSGSVSPVIYESTGVFSAEKFHEWSLLYPYGYAGVSNPMNLFYQSMEGIGLSGKLPKPTVLVMDNSIQQIPPNLLMIEGDFAGRSVPMASAPSISWLWSALGGVKSCLKRRAWISTEFAEDKNPALITVAERLHDCLEEYAIELDTRAELPDDLHDSALVVVAAHGGILPEGRFVQRLSDDSNLALYPSALANSVRNSQIVILFVCSGGRVDSHPTAETTVGLVKEILDQGCNTVIASPWPLDTRVPSHWLPPFLKHWTAGMSVIKAVYRANQNVAKELGDSPLDCLAMNVFGDPVSRSAAFAQDDKS